MGLHNRHGYFTRPSSGNNPGGMDGHTEVINGMESPWLVENKMVALCRDERMAKLIADLLNDDRRHTRRTTGGGQS